MVIEKINKEGHNAAFNPVTIHCAKHGMENRRFELGAVERGDLFPGMISPGIECSYVKLISPMTASKIQREAGRLDL